MLKYVDFDGKQVPILCGNAAFYHYEKLTGKKPMKEFIAAVGLSENTEFNPLDIGLSFFIDLAYCAFKAGGNKAGKPFTGLIEDVAAWMTEDNIPLIVEMITDALPKAPTTAEEGEGTTPGETMNPLTTGNPA